MPTDVNKYYGQNLVLNEEISLTSCVLDSLTVQPTYTVTNIGTPARAIIRRFDNAEYSGTAYFNQGATLQTIEAEIETWTEADAPVRFSDTCPAGGSTVVEFGSQELVGGDNNNLVSVEWTARYWPKVTKAAQS